MCNSDLFLRGMHVCPRATRVRADSVNSPTSTRPARRRPAVGTHIPHLLCSACTRFPSLVFSILHLLCFAHFRSFHCHLQVAILDRYISTCEVHVNSLFSFLYFSLWLHLHYNETYIYTWIIYFHIILVLLSRLYWYLVLILFKVQTMCAFLFPFLVHISGGGGACKWLN